MVVDESDYAAVIFDFYGTLTRAIRRGRLHDAVARVLDCDPAAFRAQLDRTFAARARGGYGDTRAALAAMAGALGRWPTPAQLDRAERLRRLAVRISIRLRPDAVPTLRAIRARGRRTALISDCTDELPPILATLPVAALLDAAVYSFELGVTKPHPALYRRATELLGVAAGRCLYVGDGGGRELSGARAAGMAAVRLAEPDLAGHLVFDPEPAWPGPQVRRLRDVLARL